MEMICARRQEVWFQNGRRVNTRGREFHKDPFFGAKAALSNGSETTEIACLVTSWHVCFSKNSFTYLYVALHLCSVLLCPNIFCYALFFSVSNLFSFFSYRTKDLIKQKQRSLVDQRYTIIAFRQGMHRSTMKMRLSRIFPRTSEKFGLRPAVQAAARGQLRSQNSRLHLLPLLRDEVLSISHFSFFFLFFLTSLNSFFFLKKHS